MNVFVLFRISFCLFQFVSVDFPVGISCDVSSHPSRALKKSNQYIQLDSYCRVGDFIRTFRHWWSQSAIDKLIMGVHKPSPHQRHNALALYMMASSEDGSENRTSVIYLKLIFPSFRGKKISMNFAWWAAMVVCSPLPLTLPDWNSYVYWKRGIGTPYFKIEYWLEIPTVPLIFSLWNYWE